jgi:iron complex outermembrane receptor protein
LSYSRGNNRLFGQGAAPVQSLAISSENVFTGPQNNINNLDMLTLNTTYNFTPTLALSNVVYFRNYRQTVANGDNTNYAACDPTVAPGLLCDGDYVLTDTLGQHIPDITNGGATIIGQNDYEDIHSQTWGGSLQFSSTEKVLGHGNSFAVRRDGRYLDHQLLLGDLARRGECGFGGLAVAVFRCNTGRRR